MAKASTARARAASSSPKRARVTFPSHARLFLHHVVDETAPAPIIRKDAASLTASEQTIFKSAITKAIADGTYSRLVQIHADMNHDMHTMKGMPAAGTMRFLPWHRLYLIKFEQAMRAFEPTFTVPHWRWMDQTDIPAWLKSFTPKGVVDGHGKPIPVTRNPGGDPQAPKLPTKAMIESTVMNQTDYKPFTLALEGAKPFGAHNLVHVWLNGTMSNVPTAPADPMFWMHHAEIDRIWAIWEKANPGKQPTLSGAKAILDPWPENFAEVLDLLDGDYSYAYDFMTL
jgi:tyrosinase